MVYDLIVALVSFVAGSIASVAGFGIGSFLTPLFSVRMELKVAVAVVSIPHFLATALRLWMLRRHVDRRVLVGFGMTSAAGGLLGALLHTWIQSPVVSLLFGALLVISGGTGLAGLSDRLKFGRTAAWIAGAASGLLGGLVGNQGGIRSAGLLGFDVPKHAFVATASAIGLFVDGARLPVYLVQGHRSILEAWPAVAIATAGVLVGTLVGARLLAWIPEPIFGRVVSGLVLALGIVMVVSGVRALAR